MITNQKITKENEHLIDEQFLVNTDVELSPIFDDKGEQVEESMLLRRIEDKSFLKVVSSSYEITQHKDYIVPFIKSFIDKENTEVYLFVENEGNRNRVICRIMGETVHIGEEEYRKSILLANSSDASMTRKMLAGLFRMVCLNMQFSGVPISINSKKHIKGKDKEKENFEVLTAFIETETEKMIELLQKMHNIPYDFSATIFAKSLYENNIIPKKLMTSTLSFLEDHEIFAPRSDYERIANPKSLFDLYQRITLWSSQVTFQDNITRGVNVNKNIFNNFNTYVGNYFEKKLGDKNVESNEA